MSRAYERAARRVASLTGAERDWVLSRLAPADALRIRDLMEPGAAPAQAEPEPASVAPAEPTPAAPPMLENAAAADVARLLQGEPDWFIALVLAKRRWPWDRELLATFDAARFEELGMLAWRAREGAKARACDAAIEILTARLRSLAPAPAVSSAFDELLGRVLAGKRPAPGGPA